MKWSLHNKKGNLEPFIFSNGKSQLDIVEEVIEAIKEGHKIIFIKGLCGTGKSAISLNIAKELGKTSIVVPVKNLQKQYEEDYTKKLYILKNNNEKLNITVIDGRNNHKCPFKGNCTCDNKTLPCTIEIKSENIELIKKYIDQNPFVSLNNFSTLKDVRRKSIAPVCEYWSPIICKDWFEYEYILEDAEPLEYKGLNDKTFIYNKREHGCGYYDQFISYVNSDVIIFNSKKYELETIMDRKPLTEVEIIDECDEFLDNLGNEKEINLDRLSRMLTNLKIEDKKLKNLAIEINELINSILNNARILESISNKDIFLIKDTEILKLLRYFLKNPEIVDLTGDEDSDYLYNVYNTAKSFEKFFKETYLTFYKNKYDNLVVNLITINLEKKLKEFLDKNKVFVMMSGTIHSELVLKEIFGIKEFKIIEAETKNQGKITKVRSGLEKWFNYELLKKEGSRENYLSALSKCIELAEKPVLVHVNSFSDLPSTHERSKYYVDNLKTEEELKDEQEKYKRGELVQMFKNKKIDILYSTRCNRGVDFPRDICNSIIFTRFPYPNISSLFWKVLKKSKPKHFSMFYFDKARRELLQRSYRGLRSDDDKINLLSPDSRVLNSF
ncbi:MAG: DEAD/DEAH box helicase family protein [Nanoarchaeota archaeon]|nr:DEAD/DEAH box helicase family protein [Nanoarchaeota archaeon]